ncbi:MAG: winged helix-turn-helix domain-containing protein [Methanofollis sp.]|uniref:winged helix-turn-helix domain-containing protein n=1 Tax=Methanofollis sp. TaxID=2052835 RepID=UPI0026342134|nr:winged helix-turn-helix domain-containing protein [Methanofollis sp.]MDD4254534.1 winged helix-turn-helix domain-containing protein [Methanofollis sp.]
MDPVDVVLTKDAFVALASESRLRMLKDLNVRRMTIAELAADLRLAKSTVHHHLRILVEVGFVVAEDEGHAWVYYALTPEGRALLSPRDGVRIRILLVTALLMFVGGICALMNSLTVSLPPEDPVPPMMGGGGPPLIGGGGLPVQEVPLWDMQCVGMVLMLIGSALGAYAYVKWRNSGAAVRVPGPEDEGVA